MTTIEQLDSTIRNMVMLERLKSGEAKKFTPFADHAIPEQPLQVDQPSNHRLVSFDAVDLQVLATQQYRHIRCLLAGHCQLVHYL